MSWLPRRASMRPDGSAAAAAYATELAGVVERTFPIDEAAIARVRAAALGAFIEAAATSPRRPVRRVARRSLAFGLAATVGLLAVSAVAVEARPGGPFYAVRLAIETATLASADVPAGWQARLDRLQRRIDECLAAQRDADPGAIVAALSEYRSELAGMTAGLVDPERRTSLGAAVTGDLAVVLDIERTYPSEAATLLVADIRAFLSLSVPGATNADDGTTGDPHDDGTIADPHDDGTTGDPHTDGAAGNPHDDGTTGDPHTDGAAGNPHDDGTTGNPHDGKTGNPHDDGTKGNPHDGKTGNPHAGGTNGNPHGRAEKPAKVKGD